MRIAAPCLAVALAAPAGALPVAAWAVPTTCLGQPATIVAGSAGLQSGTPGPDVVVLVREATANLTTGDGDDLVCLVDPDGGPPPPSELFAIGTGAGDDTVVNLSSRVEDGISLDFYLGDGDDVFTGGPDAETVDTGEITGAVDSGRDVVSTGDGGDRVVSGAGATTNADAIDLGPGSDSVQYGGAMVPGGAIDGGTGSDMLVWAGRLPGGPVTVDNTVGALDVAGQRWGSWTGMEGFWLGFGRRTVRFHGSALDESVRLRRSRYAVDLGPGDDVVTLDGRLAPRGTYDGGPGTDRLDALLRGRRATVDLGGVLHTWTATEHHRTRLRGFEDATAQARTLRLLGTRRANVLEAIGGDVVIDGGAGPDRLRFPARTFIGYGPPRYLALGGPGDDVLVGGAEDDELRGGAGVDEARGRGGTDRCEAEREVRCER